MHTTHVEKEAFVRKSVLKSCSRSEDTEPYWCAPPTAASHKLLLDSEAQPSRSVHVAPIKAWKTELGMCVTCYQLALEDVPADFFADPDGSWTYEALVAA